ncbi:MAG: SDR family NAD(P)-dependent oxidoreductase [Alphaproteobacteria bacterium]|nr:SDR family NAD(P)-dependent oxidoreductase [Alphaproteobacteria bacterium]
MSQRHRDAPPGPNLRALMALRALRERVQELEAEARAPIAVIGLSCRLPGAPSVDALWRMLTEGGEGVGPVPPERWDAEALYHPDPNRPGRLTSRRGGFLTGLDRFDAAFFGISSREAPQLDPRQRLILELAWEALEDAGLAPGALAGSRTASYVSVLTGDYEVISRDEDRRIEMYTGTGMSNTLLSNRLAYVFDLRGPSLTLDTACSGSLVGVHLACQELARGDSELALVGGVSVNLLSRGELFFSRANALAPDGRCKTFDARADGIVRSEGAGLVVLKRLDRALADGDRVYAVIRGSAVNQDGRSNGIMAPNGRAQEALLEEAYARAGVPPASVQYVEAHGTGTSLGDPIEVNALHAVLSRGRAPDAVCRLGSIKTNIGHTEPAAGVAGLIKAALCLHHRELVPTLHFERGNPAIPFERIPMEVQTTRGPWPRPEQPLRAGVSGFGFGGTNAHLVLEEAPAQAPAAETAVDGDWLVLPLSARSRGALRALVAAYQERIEGCVDLAALRALVRGAATAREALPERAAFVGRDAQELLARLDAWLLDEPPRPPEASGRAVFVFSGQGAYHAGMASALRAGSPCFAQAFEAAEAALVALGAEPLGPALDAPGPPDALLAQRATFATQVGLVALWRSWGVTPTEIVGHSLGEVAAAWACGALSLEQAAQVVFHRSRLMAELEGQGATAVVGLPPEAVVPRLSGRGGDLAVAGNNSPDATVISGQAEAVDAWIAELSAEGVFAQRVAGVRTAFHGPGMQPVQDALEEALADLTPEDGPLQLLSTVDAEALPGAALDAEYWGRNVREPFRFAEVIDELLSATPPVFIEIAPHALLGPAMHRTARARGVEAAVIASLRRGVDAARAMAEAVARAFELGLSPDWTQVNPAGPRSLSLPSYPWQRQHFWLDQVPPHSPPLVPWMQGAGPRQAEHPLLGARVEVVETSRTLWAGELSTDRPGWLADHRALGRVILPGAAFAELALSALAAPGQPAAIAELSFLEALPLGEEARPVQVQLDAERGQVQIFSAAPGETPEAWRLHARARRGPEGSPDTATPTLAELRARCPRPLSVQAHDEALARLGLSYGPAFRTVRELRLGEGEVLGQVALDPLVRAERYHLHPALLDGCFQLAAHLGDGTRSRLPEGIEGLRVTGRPARSVWTHLRARPEQAGEPLQVDLRLFDEDGALVAEVQGLRLRAVGEGARSEASAAELIHRLDWVPEPAPITSIGRLEGGWLVLAEAALAAPLAEGLRARGATVQLAEPGALGDEARRAALIAALTADPGRPWQGLVLAPEAEDEARAVEAASVALLRLLQDISGLERGAAPPPRTWLLTRGVPMGIDEAGGPTGLVGAALWGLGRVLALEMPSLWGGAVDTGALPPADAARALLAELDSGRSGQQVLHRGGQRRAPRLRRVPSAAAPLPTARGGAVLISGGLSGLGLALARAMVEAGARRLVLLGRTPLPPRAAWRGLAEDHPAAARVAAVLELEARGAAVHPHAVDVADKAALAEVLEGYAAQGYPPIRVVVHAAGVLRDGVLLRVDPEDLAQVMRPKLAGAQNLAALTKDLERFVLFGSLTGVIGRVGQASYAAANAALDAFAHQLRAQGCPACALDWGPWGETGMFARLPEAARSGPPPISDARGLEALARALAADLGQAVIADLSGLPEAPIFSELPRTAPTADPNAEGGEAGGEPLLELFLAEEHERGPLITQRLSVIVGEVFRTAPESLNPRQALANLGLDSLMALELAQATRRDYGVRIPIQDIFALSLRELAARVREAVVLDDAVLEQLLDEIEALEAG